MAALTFPVSTETLLSSSAAASLASATYVSMGVIDMSAVDPSNLIIRVGATPGTVSGNKQVVVFAKTSIDNSTFSTGPESGTTTTDEPNLHRIGVLPLNTNSTKQTKFFSVTQALGFTPPYCKIILKNDSGAALAATGTDVYSSYETGNSA